MSRRAVRRSARIAARSTSCARASTSAGAIDAPSLRWRGALAFRRHGSDGAFRTVSMSSQSLVIAPQWIGDAVMTEPLLRRLRARGERLAVGALPWVAPVYRAMPQVDQVIEFPFRHGGLQ